MTDDDLRRLYEAGGHPAPPSGRTDCPTPDALLAFAEGKLRGETRLSLAEHLVECAACRTEFDLLDAVVVAGRGYTRRRPTWLAVAAVLAIAVGGGAIWRIGAPGRGSPEPTRGEDAGVVLVAPSGITTIEAAQVFVWRVAPGAMRYQLWLTTPGGAAIWTGTTRDTTLALPPEVMLGPGRDYSWWVEAVAEGGERRRSLVAMIRMMPATKRSTMARPPR